MLNDNIYHQKELNTNRLYHELALISMLVLGEKIVIYGALNEKNQFGEIKILNSFVNDEDMIINGENNTETCFKDFINGIINNQDVFNNEEASENIIDIDLKTKVVSFEDGNNDHDPNYYYRFDIYQYKKLIDKVLNPDEIVINNTNVLKIIIDYPLENIYSFNIESNTINGFTRSYLIIKIC